MAQPTMAQPAMAQPAMGQPAISRPAEPLVAVAALWRVMVGTCAGFVLGLDVVLACLVEQLLKAGAADDLLVPGILHSGWSAERGVFFDLGPGGFAVFAACTLMGAACGWAFARRRPAAEGQAGSSAFAVGARSGLRGFRRLGGSRVQPKPDLLDVFEV